MKLTLLTLATFALAITALHAQAVPIPGVDPAVQAAVQAAVPTQYAAYGSLILVVGMILGRIFTALKNNGGIAGIYNSVVHGTTPAAKLLLLTGLSLSMMSCTLTPATKQQLITAGTSILITGTEAYLVSGGNPGAAVTAMSAEAIADVPGLRKVIAANIAATAKNPAAPVTISVAPAPIDAPPALVVDATSGK